MSATESAISETKFWQNRSLWSHGLLWRFTTGERGGRRRQNQPEPFFFGWNAPSPWSRKEINTKAFTNDNNRQKSSQQQKEEANSDRQMVSTRMAQLLKDSKFSRKGEWTMTAKFKKWSFLYSKEWYRHVSEFSESLKWCGGLFLCRGFFSV